MTALAPALVFATAGMAGRACGAPSRGVALQSNQTAELTARVPPWHNTGQGGTDTNCASAVEPFPRRRAMRSKGET